MDTQNPNVPAHAHTRVAGKKHPNRRHPHSGLVHDNTRHTTRFTVIGNHLAQHPELSLLAIGLSVHIQSLPAGARIDIKSLAARFPEGTTRIAAALRELETHGYLRRTRERVPDGRIITRTTSCNRPGHSGRDAPRPTPRKRTRQPGGKPLPAVPRPAYPAPALLQQATDLLTGLRREDTRLLLSGCDTAHLAPGVAAWLERDVSPAAVRHALTADLPPEPLHRPAPLLAHRLTAQLPPPPPFAPPQAPPPPTRHPLQTCDGCDRAFRSPTPGHCRDCRDSRAAAALPARTPRSPAQSPSSTGPAGTPEVISAVSGVARSRGENRSGPS
ncbi:helix-turn-helix domain-containing protein [Streptomyces luteogriseus]|uniref:helix-turn-helix domain-containing protein n=1 Tax=Streptomyces luteogriseus TaxID=68233 RepID=UPI002E3787D6|nr:helix-turn-helix domain-containing protein [Streptomyces luteogriseus]WTJ33193.1 helix-turn-helix domain-containing protein [Streptomyces luteogriseus]